MNGAWERVDDEEWTLRAKPDGVRVADVFVRVDGTWAWGAGLDGDAAGDRDGAMRAAEDFIASRAASLRTEAARLLVLAERPPASERMRSVAQEMMTRASILLRALLLLLLTGCAHTPPPGDACPPWQAGWIEYRRTDCTYWRCNAATLRMEQVAREEVCGW